MASLPHFKQHETLLQMPGLPLVIALYFLGFCYDTQTNMAGSGIDSRVIGRSGFVVDNKSKYGMSSRGIGQSHLTESVDSKQAALNLGATAKYV